MGETLTTRDSEKTFTVPPGLHRTFRLTTLTRRLVEIADEHFHTDSAVAMPDVRKTKPADPADDEVKPRASLLTALAKVLRFSEKSANGEGEGGKKFQLLIAGHADT